MGTISDKLMRIINTKEDIRQALISKGYDVPTSIPFKEYAKMILDLPCRVDSFPDIEGIVARYSALGLTNEQMAENPIWKDLTGNGHDLQMKNFAWKGMSGVGGYVDNWNSSADWDINSYWVNSHTDHKLQFITAGSVVQARSNNIYNAENVYKNILNVNGLTEAVNKGAVGGLRISATDPITSKAIKSFSFKTDGIIQISFDDVLQDYYVVYFVYGNNTNDIDITIEQLPLYPGALVFDGVDDYGTCNNFPVLTKEKGYTVVALRQWITMGEGALGLVSNVKNWLKDGAFLLEYRNIQADHLNKPISFGAIGSENDLPHILTYQTSKSYNGVSITTGNFEGTDVLHVGKLAPTNVGTCINAAIWELVFLDHDATEEELTKIKDYFVKTYPWLFPDQAWTVTGKTNEDEDRATIANITGNGNNLVLSNFGFSENSGYGSYPFGMNVWNPDYIADQPYGTVHYPNDSKSYATTVKNNATNFRIKFRLRGLPEGGSFLIRVFDMNDLNTVLKTYTYTENGIHEFVYNDPNKPARIILYNGNTISNISEFYLDIIPEYEGYLVTDGVDDKIVSSFFGMGKDFTIVGDWKFIDNKKSSTGLVKASSFYIYNTMIGLDLYINSGSVTNSLDGIKSINAACSDGRAYDRNWNEILANTGNVVGSGGILEVSSSGGRFDRIAFKNLAIYPRILSKDDCIKAYKYLQTLKAK